MSSKFSTRGVGAIAVRGVSGKALRIPFNIDSTSSSSRLQFTDFFLSKVTSRGGRAALLDLPVPGGFV